MTFTQAMLFPLATAALLMRHVRDVSAGGDSPDNPVIAAMVRARSRVRRWYEATHRIIDAEGKEVAAHG